MATRIAAHAEPIPGYRLIERIGRGGFGEVWKAEAPGGILKAIKFVYGDLQEAMEDGRPAEQELKALNRIKAIRHPYILSLERYDIIDGQLTIVMELADRNLFDRFRECQRAGLAGIPHDELLQYLEEASEALDLMNNEYQIQHLDVKPQNIFLVHNHIKVADFGLAKDLEGKQATLTGGVTPVYAAPETFEGRVSRFCDQYSLAILYQEMLTGRRPFNGESARQLMMQHVTGTPDVQPLAASDQSAVLRALAKNPDERFASCTEFVHALMSEPPAAESDADGASLQGAVRPAAVVAAVATPPVRRLGVELQRASDKLPALSTHISSRNAKTNLDQAAPKVREPVAEVTGSGVLMPAVVIGLGRTGLLVLQRLRRLVQDRFGTAKLPHIELLYIDTDADTLQQLNTAEAPAMLETSEVFLARLSRPSHYLRDDERFPGLDHWLNPELLYRIPRNPATEGVRALGRLAFCDCHRKLTNRIRVKIEASAGSQALDQSDQATGLGKRTNFPHVYVVTNLGGGSGSGMFLDVAYATRKLLKSLGYMNPEVHGVLMLPPVEPYVPPRAKSIANTHAALTELFHFSSPQTAYVATLDRKAEPYTDGERPFQRCMLLPAPEAVGPGSSKATIGHCTGFLFRELLTPFGRDSERLRCESTHVVGLSAYFQTHGCFRFTWPRRNVVHVAALRTSLQLLRFWMGEGHDDLAARSRNWCDEQWRTRGLDGDRLAEQLSDEVAKSGNSPGESLTAILTPLEQRQHESIEPGAVRAAFQHLLATLGFADRKSMPGDSPTLARQMKSAATRLAKHAGGELDAIVAEAIDTPALRLAGAEQIVQHASDRLKSALDHAESRIGKLTEEADQSQERMQAMAASMDRMSLGARRLAIGREVLGLLSELGAKKLEVIALRCVADVFRCLLFDMSERLRYVQSQRSQIETLQKKLQAIPADPDAEKYLGPHLTILPGACRSVAEAAQELVARLTSDDLARFDLKLQGPLERQFQSLAGFCRENFDRSGEMMEFLQSQSANFLQDHIPRGSAADLYLSTEQWSERFDRDLRRAFEEAAPAVTSQVRRDGQLFLLGVPSDDSGSRFARMVENTIADVRFTMMPEASDVFLYREHPVSPIDLPHLARKVREFVAQSESQEKFAAHARFDISWLQLHRD